MLIRLLKENKFEELNKSLMMKANPEPWDASYTVKLMVDGSEYGVKLQPERNQKMAILQALRIYRSENGVKYELITKNVILSAILEILVYQGIS